MFSEYWIPVFYTLNVEFYTAIVVEEPECGGKCSKNAVCRGDKCVCKRGFRGDGINCDSKSISNTICNINVVSFLPTCIDDLNNFYPILKYFDYRNISAYLSSECCILECYSLTIEFYSNSC